MIDPIALANRLRSEAADVVDELIETGLDPMDL